MIYGIAGDGRMARHFKAYLDLLGRPARQWSRRMEEREGLTPEAALAGCEVVLVLLKDGAIEPWIASHPFLRGRKLIHFSGALVTPLAQGFHPLMSFGNELYDLATYEALSFVCEAGEHGFEEIFPGFRNPNYVIHSELKPLYHALCVLGGNLSVLLWQKLFRDLEGKMGIPAHAAMPYLRQVARNLEAAPDAALTGPIQRGDQATIASNLRALEGDAYGDIYRSFIEAGKEVAP